MCRKENGSMAFSLIDSLSARTRAHTHTHDSFTEIYFKYHTIYPFSLSLIQFDICLLLLVCQFFVCIFDCFFYPDVTESDSIKLEIGFVATVGSNYSEVRFL